MGMLYQYFDGQLKEEIRTEANYLAHAVNISGEEYLTEPGAPVTSASRLSGRRHRAV